MKLEMHTYVWGPEDHFRWHLQEHQPHALRQGSHWPATHQLGHTGWPVGPRNPTASVFPVFTWLPHQLFMWELETKLQSPLLWSKLFTNQSISLAPRFSLLEGSLIIDSVSSLIIGPLGCFVFFFSWCCHDYSMFPGLYHFLLFPNLLGYSCESILGPRGLWRSLKILQPGVPCSRFHLWLCFSHPSPVISPAKSLDSLVNHPHLHLFCCSLSSISLPPALVPSALSCCLWVCLALLLLPLTVELGCLRPDSPPPPPSQRVGMYNANVPFKTRFCAHKFQDIVSIFVSIVCLVGWALISV